MGTWVVGRLAAIRDQRTWRRSGVDEFFELLQGGKWIWLSRKECESKNKISIEIPSESLFVIRFVISILFRAKNKLTSYLQSNDLSVSLPKRYLYRYYYFFYIDWYNYYYIIYMYIQKVRNINLKCNYLSKDKKMRIIMIIFSKSDSRTLAINFILIRISRRISQIERRNLNSGKLIAPIGPFITKTSLIVFFFFCKGERSHK